MQKWPRWPITFASRKSWPGGDIRQETRHLRNPAESPFNVRWEEALPHAEKSKNGGLCCGHRTEEKATAFNRVLMYVTAPMNFTSSRPMAKPERLMASVPIMYQLKYQAMELMKIPTGNGDETAGPTFEYMAS